jgi:hypothetical protein
LFIRHEQAPAFVSLVSPSFTYDWPAYKGLLDQTLQGLAEPELSRAVGALIQGVFWSVYKRDEVSIPDAFTEWLLDQLLRVADIDALGSMTEHRLEEILKVVGRAPLRWLPKALKLRAALEATHGHGKFRALGFQSSFGEFVEPIEEGATDRKVVTEVIEELLGLVDDQGTVGYRLKEVLRDVDPHGVVLAEAVASRIRSGGIQGVQKYARLARSYVVNTEPWRTIALPIVELAASLDAKEERRALFAAISGPEIRTWSGKRGEVASVFVTAVENAKRHRDQEKDGRFSAFWDWYVGVAEADLEHETERAREDRGE